MRPALWQCGQPDISFSFTHWGGHSWSAVYPILRLLCGCHDTRVIAPLNIVQDGRESGTIDTAPLSRTAQKSWLQMPLCEKIGVCLPMQTAGRRQWLDFILKGPYYAIISRFTCLHALMFKELFLFLILPVLQHLFSLSVWNQSPVCSDWLADWLCCDWSIA